MVLNLILFIQFPGTCLDFCIAFFTVAQMPYSNNTRLLAVPSRACIMKGSLSCTAPAEQAPSQFPIQYTNGRMIDVFHWLRPMADK